jgi:hypothetical protein
MRSVAVHGTVAASAGAATATLPNAATMSTAAAAESLRTIARSCDIRAIRLTDPPTGPNAASRDYFL